MTPSAQPRSLDERDPLRAVAAGVTPLHRWEIADSLAFGRLLFIDGDLQSSASDQAQYHAALVAPALRLATRPIREVVLAGTGPGGALRVVLDAVAPTARVVAVDIDRALVEAIAPHLESWHRGAHADPRVTWRWDDALDVLAALPERSVDLLVVDLTDPRSDRAAAVIDTPALWREAARVLGPGGACAMQAGAAVGSSQRVQTWSRFAGPALPLALSIASFASFDESWAFVHGVRHG